MTGGRASERTSSGLPRLSPWIAAIAGLQAAVLIAMSTRYGYHRDELYFRMLGSRPAWGYVDQPPATPMLARLAGELFGDHLWALRVPGALAAAATAVLTALLARELGGRRGAQVLAALGAGTAFPLVFGHVLLTATVDMVVTAAVVLFVARALLRDERWWLAAGGVVGLGLFNKHLILLTLLALGLGLLVSGPRRALASRWLWAGVALALAVGAPNIVYQATHGWPQVTMAGAIERTKGGDSRVLFVPMQLVLLGVLLAPVWVTGLVRLLRSASLRPVRAIGVAYPALCLLVLLTGGQPYYTLGLVLALYAAGCEPVVRWVRGRAGRRAVLAAGVAVNAVVSALIALPLLPVPALAATPIPAANQATADQVGWPAYVRQVAATYDALPPGERPRAVILAANYGEAGAIERFGDRHRLPAVYSGHNELWYRARPPETATVVIAVGYDNARRIGAAFRSCAFVAGLDNGVDIPNEEQEHVIRVCRDPRQPWSRLWPRFRHYD